MRFKRGINLIIALLVTAPMLPWLAVFPQTPDGAELLTAAVNGGLLEIPVQPGWALSFGSWLGLVGSLFFLLQTLTVWNFSWITKIASAVAFSYFPIVWRMAIQPEKFTWIALTFCLCFHAFSLYFSQKRKRWLLYSALATALTIATLIQLPRPTDAASAVDGLTVALHQLLQFNVGLLLILFGVLATMKSHKAIAFLLGWMFLGAVVVLSLVRMPADDLMTTMGHMERYPLILIPTLILYYACGLESLLRLMPSFRIAIAALVVLSLAVTISHGREDAYAVNNNLIELSHNEVAPELSKRSSLDNSLQICKVLDKTTKRLATTSNYFAQKVLKDFQLTMQGAADLLISTHKVTSGDLANQLAASLQPGISPEEWRRLCQAYTARLSSSLN